MTVGPEERLQALGVLEHARDEARREPAETVRAVLVGERVLRRAVSEREMEVEPGAALVAERPSHERREQTLADGDLLHRRLEHERAVGGAESVRVLDVDLVLRVHELVVRGERLEAELVAPEEHLQHDVARIRDRADGVDPRELVHVPADAARCLLVSLDEEELELGRDDGLEVPLGVRLDDAPQKRARADRPGLGAVERARLAEAPRDLGLPRDDAERLEVGTHREVDVPLLPADDRACGEGLCP